MHAVLEAPPQTPSFEDLPYGGPEFGREPIDPPTAERIGALAIDGDVDTTYIEEGLAQFNTYLATEADSPTNQPVDGRVYDIEAAHAAAIVENEMFDAHTAAIEEDQEREQLSNDIEQEEQEDSEAVEEQSPLESADTNVDPATVQPEADRFAVDYRTQAESVLEEAGYPNKLPIEAKVRKDHATGNLLVVTGNDIKVVKLHSGGGPKVVEYAYDKHDKVLTARVRGLVLGRAQIDDFEPGKASERELSAAVKLPAVAA